MSMDWFCWKKTLHTGNPWPCFFADFDGENHGNSGFDFPFQSSDSSDFGDGSLPNMSTRRDRCSKFSAQQNDPWWTAPGDAGSGDEGAANTLHICIINIIYIYILCVYIYIYIIYNHLWSSMIIYDHLWSSMIIYNHLWSSIIIYDHL